MARVLVVGGGPAGCASAHFLSDAGHDVTLVEATGVLGGSSRTMWHGGHPYHFGPRHFLTREERVWNFLNSHLPMKLYRGHEFLTYVEQDRQFWHFPIHRDEVDEMPDVEDIRREWRQIKPDTMSNARNLEEYWLFSLGSILYGKFIRDYSQKMWPDIVNTDITDFGFSPKGVALKTGPIRAAWSESMSGFPLARDGYDGYWLRATDNVNVRLNTWIDIYDLDKRQVWIRGEQWAREWDIIVLTISPDKVFERCYGELRYMGRDFDPIVVPAWHLPDRCALPPHVFFLYYASHKQAFTRIVEYKKFFEWDMDSPTTLLGVERPSKRNKLYPYPTAVDQALAQRYHDLAPANVYWMGRNGKYRYEDFGMILEDCFRLMERIK